MRCWRAPNASALEHLEGVHGGGGSEDHGEFQWYQRSTLLSSGQSGGRRLLVCSLTPLLPTPSLHRRSPFFYRRLIFFDGSGTREMVRDQGGERKGERNGKRDRGGERDSDRMRERRWDERIKIGHGGVQVCRYDIYLSI